MNDNFEADEFSRTALAAESTASSAVRGAPSDLPASEETVLRQKARDALWAGRMPSGKPASMWGGPGSGAACAVCGKQVSGSQLGFELEFAPGGNDGEPLTHHVHIPCFAAWEFECQSVLQGVGEVGTIHARDSNAPRSKRGSR